MNYRRRTFLINKPFQLRYAFYVCSWLFALSLMYPLIIYNLFDYFMRYLVTDPMGPAVSSLAMTRKDILWLLILLQILFLTVTFLISIFISHRIAGPVYKLRKFLADAIAGNKTDKLVFRKDDHFQELADDYNKLLAHFEMAGRKKHDSILTAITSIEKALPQSNADSRQELERTLALLRESIA